MERGEGRRQEEERRKGENKTRSPEREEEGRER
jgi:hypothetical protein